MEKQNNIIEVSIIINATPQKVWEVFTNPTLTRQMGGEYVTNWEVGGDFGFKMNGEMVTHGRIAAITPRAYLEHTLVDAQGEIMSTISYRLQANDDGTTLLQGREQFAHSVSQQEYTDGEKGWQDALAAVRRIAERA